MTTVFTDFFRLQLYNSLDKTVPIDPTQNLMTGKTVHWVLFSRYAAPSGEADVRYTAIKTVSELVAIPGWSAALAPTSGQVVGTTTSGTVTYCIANLPFTMAGGWTSRTVVAAALILEGSYGGTTDPIILITDDPFSGATVVESGDSLVARPLAAVAGNRPLFSWPVFITGQTTTVTTPGSIAMVEAAPSYEVAYTQHAWLYPQRTNFIANPSFEGGTNHWRANGALTKVQGTPTVPAAPSGGAWFGRIAGPTAGYLDATVGTVTTPDPGPVPAQYHFVVDCTTPLNTPAPSFRHIAAQFEGPGREWIFGRETGMTLGSWADLIYPTGNATTPLFVVYTNANGTTLPTGNRERWAATFDRQAAQTLARLYQPDASGAWVQVQPTNTVATTPITDGSSLLRIGGWGASTTDRWPGRIYSVEMRTGLTPGGGSIIWRFDANEYVSGTSFTDARGRVWTLTTASAITPKVGDQTSVGYAIAESNLFPLTTRVAVGGEWTIQAMVRGVGKLRVGLLAWSDEVVETGADWGDSEVWDLPPNGFLHVYARRRSYENVTGLVRFECQGGPLEIDNVLIEPDWLKDWAYFDGDSTYGARDDYAWYGGENRKGTTYSTWYNHKRAVTGRLFAWDIAAEDYVITDEEVEAQGYVYKWVPAGVRVTPHIDVLFPGDIQEAVADHTVSTVTRYKTSPTDLLGVLNPWL